jgi:hypothetical protein
VLKCCVNSGVLSGSQYVRNLLNIWVILSLSKTTVPHRVVLNFFRLFLSIVYRFYSELSE